MSEQGPTDSSVEPRIGWRRRLRNFADDYLPQGRWVAILGAAFGVYVLVVLVLGLYWSIAPPRFDVLENAQRYADSTQPAPVTGIAFAAASSAGSLWQTLQFSMYVG